MSVIALVLVVALWSCSSQERRFYPNRRAKMTQAFRRFPRQLCFLVFEFLFVCGANDAWRADVTAACNDIQMLLPSTVLPEASPSLVSGIILAQALFLATLLLELSSSFATLSFEFLVTGKMRPAWRSKIPIWAKLPCCQRSRHALYEGTMACVV